MANGSPEIELSVADLQAVTGYAVTCALPALAIFEAARPDDGRPRTAVELARAFAEGGKRTKAIRDGAWAAHKAAQEARDDEHGAAGAAARAAGHACGAAYLHPLARATQVGHILGAAACAARAHELLAGDEPAVGAEHVAQAAALAPPVVVDVLRRFPAAPPGGGRVGELIRQLDSALR